MNDPLLDDLRAIVRETFPHLAYLGVKEYRVFSASPPVYELQPTDPKAGLPPIPACRVKPGIPGLTSELAEGSLVYVAFINGDAAKPIILGVSGPDDDGFTPTSLSLDAGSIALSASGSVDIDGVSVQLGNGGTPGLGAPVVRAGDVVQVGSTSGVISIVTPFGTPPTPTKVLA